MTSEEWLSLWKAEMPERDEEWLEAVSEIFGFEVE